jgi:hypothetical protein
MRMVYQLRYYDDLMGKECFIQSPQMRYLLMISSELMYHPARYRRVILQEFKDRELEKLS